MNAVIDNVTFISNSKRDWVDSQTGEKKTFYKALFVQDGSEPLEISIADDLYGTFTKFGNYNLDIELNSYNRRFSCKVVGHAVA